jgi:heat shock protein HslJ
LKLALKDFYMQYIKLFIFLLLVACSGSKKSNRTATPAPADIVKDSIEFYEVGVEVRQKNHLDLLLGSWHISSMRRQSRMEEDLLTDVYITFVNDSAFNGNGGCNRISGKYILKGTGIKFSQVVATKMACEQLEKETAFLQLLQETVSAYTVTADQLLLRDGAANVVFTANRRKE